MERPLSSDALSKGVDLRSGNGGDGVFLLHVGGTKPIYLYIYLSIYHLSIYCIYLFGSADYSITKTCNGEESETPWTMRLSVLTGSLFLLPKANIWGTVEEKD